MRGIRRTALALASLALAAPPAAADVEPITVCAHVSITGSTPSPYHTSRFGGFYFDYLNAEHGGIDGTPVRWLAFDDGSYPAGARGAVEKCRREGAQLVVGLAPHRHVTDSVVKWAAQTRTPYLTATLAPPSVADGDSRMVHGLAAAATEQLRELAYTVADNADALAGGATPRIALFSPDTWPASASETEAFVEAARERGSHVWVYDGSSATTFWTEARARGISIVTINASVNVFLQLMAAKPPDLDPGLAGTQDLASNYVGEWATQERMAVFSDHPAYDPDDDTLPWASEIDEFLEIFQGYSPEQEPPPSDRDWASYLLAKRVARILDAAEGTLTPAGLATLLAGYEETARQAWPSCPLRFTAGDRVGAETWNTFASRPRGWTHAATCERAATGLDYTRHLPSIACGPVTLTDDELTCAISEPHAGIAGYSGTVFALDGGTSFAATTVGCPTETTAAIPVPAGASIVSITATGCDGWRATATVAVVATG